MPQLSNAVTSVKPLPERVLQFGTGVLLRGLPDYLIDQANRQGRFNGSIVVVKSTSTNVDEFSQQDNLYTVAVRGVRAGQEVSEDTLITAISRVLAAQTQWQEVLDLAKKPSLQVIISNTTEVGIQYVEESIFQKPPQSFPGKLTAFLYERFRNYGGSRKHGIVVVPTELITDNGLKLREIVERLAIHNELGKLFMKWLKYHVRFCNSLVDRIVTSADGDAQQRMAASLGYDDGLLTLTEPYHLWAIEGDDRVKKILAFADNNPNIIIDEDITFYRERKLRILNGTHTFTVPLGYLMGFETVFENNSNPITRRFIEQLMLDEVVPTVPTDLMGDDGPPAVRQFAEEVLDRFLNPNIEHLLLNITLQQTSKMQARNVPTLQRYYEQFGTVPPAMALGFAGYLLFMRAVQVENGQYMGEVSANGGQIAYPIRDDKAAYFYDRWQAVTTAEPASVSQFVQAICADTDLWGTDLTILPGWAEAVATNLTSLLTKGVATTLTTRV